MYIANSNTKIHILRSLFSIETLISFITQNGELKRGGNALSAWGKTRHFYPWGLKRGSGWAIFARVGKLQLNRQWYGKHRICAVANWRHKANESARIILPMTSIARGLQCARRTACAPSMARARPALLFSLAGCSMNRKPDFNPSWQWRDADAKIRRNNSYPRNPTPEFKRFWN